MFLQLGEIGMICDPANVMTNPESVVAVMLSKFSSVFADLKAAGETVQMGANLSMEESTKSALAEMRKSNRTTIPRPSLLVTPSQSRSTGNQSKCEILLGGRVVYEGFKILHNRFTEVGELVGICRDIHSF
jgi:hypothetical protein